MSADCVNPEVRYNSAPSASGDVGGHRSGTLLGIGVPQYANLTSIKIGDFNAEIFATGISWDGRPKLTDLCDADDSRTPVGAYFVKASNLRRNTKIRAVLVGSRTLLDKPGWNAGVHLARSWHASGQVP